MTQFFVRKSILVWAGLALSAAAPVASGAGLTLNVAGCDSVDFVNAANGVISLTCTNSAPGTAPSSCSLSPSTGAVGAPISFNASCTTGTPVTTYLWSVTPSSAATFNPSTATGSQQITFNAAATLTVTPKDANGAAGAQQQAFITSGSNPPPGAWAGTCPGFTKTLVKAFDWSIPGNMRVDTVDLGGIGPSGVLVASFTTPNVPGFSGALMNISAVEFPGTQSLAGKTVVVSEGAPACNLTYSLGWGSSGSQQVTMYLAYGVPSASLGVLKPNTTYFVTVANFSSGRGSTGPTCTTKCDLRLEMIKPSGL